MALTRADVESVIVSRVGSLMTQAGLDGTTIDGTNADLNDPIGWAVRQLGYTVADITSVADTDIDDVGAADYDKLLDHAEYRALLNIDGNLTLVDTKVGPRSESLNQLRAGVEKLLEAKKAQLVEDYDYGLRLASFDVH